MKRTMKKFFISLAGIACLFFGCLFLLLPGPAVILLPLGLALLSLEYPLAKIWLRKCQRWMSINAKKMDKILYRLKKS